MTDLQPEATEATEAAEAAAPEEHAPAASEPTGPSPEDVQAADPRAEDAPEDVQTAGSAEGSEPAGAPDPAEAIRRLEEEGDVAADYVEELLDIADLDGDIDIEVRGDRVYVSVVSEEDDEHLRGLVGREGRTLDALQELARLAVLTATGHRSRLILDVCGHRERRQAELRRLAAEAVERVRGGEERVHLEPMGAYERKIVHDVVAEAGLESESEGEGPRRHVVISADV